MTTDQIALLNKVHYNNLNYKFNFLFDLVGQVLYSPEDQVKVKEQLEKLDSTVLECEMQTMSIKEDK